MKCLTKLFVFCQEKQDYVPLDKCESCWCYKHVVRENNEWVVVCEHEKFYKNKK